MLNATNEVIDFSLSLRKKEAKELMRVNLTVLGLCPQCNGDNYRSGICEDCGFISPEVQEAIKEFETAQNTPVKVPKPKKQDDEGFSPGYPKAASANSSVTTYFDYMKKTQGDKLDLCPNGHLMDETHLFCREPECTYERPPAQLDFKAPSYTGISPNIEQKRVFISPAEKRITVMKNKLKNDKKKKKTSKKSENSNEEMNGVPGTTLDDSSVAASDKVTRGQQMLEDAAKIEYFKNLQGEDEEN